MNSTRIQKWENSVVLPTKGVVPLIASTSFNSPLLKRGLLQMEAICLAGSNAQSYAIVYVIELKRISIVGQMSIAQFCGNL